MRTRVISVVHGYIETPKELCSIQRPLPGSFVLVRRLCNSENETKNRN